MSGVRRTKTTAEDQIQYNLQQRFEGAARCLMALDISPTIKANKLLNSYNELSVAQKDPTARNIRVARTVIGDFEDYVESETGRTTDECTGLPNRNAYSMQIQNAIQNTGRPSSTQREIFDEDLREMLREIPAHLIEATSHLEEKPVEGENTYYAAILLDLDRFKGLNDDYGHDAGDECLAKLGQRLKEIVRGGDLRVARIGGDEFMITVEANAGTPEEAIEQFDGALNRIRNDLKGLNVKYQAPKTGEEFTFAIVSSAGMHIVQSDDTASQIKAGADMALMQDKKTKLERYEQAIELLQQDPAITNLQIVEDKRAEVTDVTTQQVLDIVASLVTTTPSIHIGSHADLVGAISALSKTTGDLKGTGLRIVNPHNPETNEPATNGPT